MNKIVAVIVFLVLIALTAAAMQALAVLDRESSSRFFEKFQTEAERASLRGDVETALRYQTAAVQQAKNFRTEDFNRPSAETALGRLYLRTGNFANAETCFRAAIGDAGRDGSQWARSSDGKWLLNTARTGVAVCLLAHNKDQQEARTLLEKTLEEERACLASENTPSAEHVAQTVDTLLQLAMLNEGSSQHAGEVGALYRSAIELAESQPPLTLLKDEVAAKYLEWLNSSKKRSETAGLSVTDQIEDLRMQARLSMRAGDLKAARQKINQAIMLAQKNGLRKAQVLSLLDLADLVANQMDDDEVHRILQECIVLSADDLSMVDRIISRRCKIYLSTKDRRNPALLPLLMKQLAVREKMYGKADRRYAEKVCDLAEEHRLLGHLDEAGSMFRQALPAIERYGSPEDKANLYAQLAMTMIGKNDIHAWKELTGKMLEQCKLASVPPWDNRNITRCLQSAMSIASDINDYPEAYKVSRPLLEALKKLEFKDQDILRAAVVLGCSATMLNDFQTAKSAFQDADEFITRAPDGSCEEAFRLTSKQLEIAVRQGTPAQAKLLQDAIAGLHRNAGF